MSVVRLPFILIVLSMLAIACGPPSGPENPLDKDGGKESQQLVREEALKKFEEGIAIFRTNPVKAKQLFEEAVDEDETFGEAWYNLALVQESAGDIPGAITSYENAIKSRPDMAEPNVNLGVILLQKGEREKAKELFMKVVNETNGIDPFNVEANLDLGMIYRLEGEEIVAKDNIGKDLSTQINEGEVVERDIVVSDEAKVRFAEAVKNVRRALAGDSNNITSYENLAAIYYDLDSLEVATLVCQQAIQKEIDRNAELEAQLAAKQITQAEFNEHEITAVQMSAVYNTFGLVWMARGEVALAYANFKTAMELDPVSTEALFNVAGIAVNVQDYAMAYQTYGDILKTEPNNREARLSQAVAARGLDNLAEAEQVYDALLKDDPTYSPATFNKAVLYQEYHRDLVKAKSIYEEFIAMPAAAKQAPAYVAEAQRRVKQIEDIWEAQKKAEEEQKKIEKEMKELEELQKQRDKEYEDAEKAEKAAAEAAAGGGAANGETPPADGEKTPETPATP
ncbi:MAG: hypothetical protein AUK47_15400 [Deltaproteobacteria bacterium CG2_30_63_29]|nr:MAG: hypothetical protein AUK47_15400 [Deltaproteobacteria bacterium CG2_30_63_29]